MTELVRNKSKDAAVYSTNFDKAGNVCIQLVRVIEIKMNFFIFTCAPGYWRCQAVCWRKGTQMNGKNTKTKS